MMGGEDRRFDWRRGVAASIALLATIALLALVWLVRSSNDARDRAAELERHAYDVTLLTRTVNASLATSEAALGRFVLDEDRSTSGSIYRDEWRLATIQIAQLERLVRRDPQQRVRVEELQQLFRTRADELGLAARAANDKEGLRGISLFYEAGRSPTAPALAAKLKEIANAERDSLSASIQATRGISAQAGQLTDYLSYLGIIVAFFGLAMGALALRTLQQYMASNRQAQFESARADTLEAAVAERTAELEAANVALRAEAEEREQVQAQLRQVQKMEAVGQLTGGIAHDFNNMLAVVVGGLDLARRRIDGPRRELTAHLNNAMDGATRAAALTRRLLAFSRAEPLLPERVDPARLVLNTRDLLDRTLGEQVRITLDLEDGAWPVFVDATQLENALLNLALNARDAMDGTGTLTISSRNVTLGDQQVGDVRAGEYLRLAVADTGHGMTPDVLERAFEPFFTTKETGKGTGLGLSQIFGFAHQSGGEVGIESTVGEGTTVSLYIPRGSAQDDNVHLHPTARSDEDAPLDLDVRILVVEDDPRVRVATVGALEDLGYTPKACGSGKEALALFEPGTFDLVISDVVMPEMTGPELVSQIKRRQADIAILFVTGYTGEGGGAELEQHEILRKPFTVSALSSAVAAALRPSGSPPTSEAAATG